MCPLTRDAAESSAPASTLTVCRRLQCCVIVVVVSVYIGYIIVILSVVMMSDSTELNPYMDSDSRIRGGNHCLDNMCVNKCCLDHEDVVLSGGTTECGDANHNKVFSSRDFVKRVVLNDYQTHVENRTNKFLWIYYLYGCQGKIERVSRHEANNEHKIYFKNGSLVIESMRQFVVLCVDYFRTNDVMIVMGCYNQTYNSSTTNGEDGIDVSSWYSFENVFNCVVICCMLISTTAIVMTLCVYIYLPELRNIHGKVLFCYLLSIAVFHPPFVLAVISGNNDMNLRNMLSILALVVALTWLTIMCYDIWSRFSRPLQPRVPRSSGGKPSDRLRFKVYSYIGWGCPILLFALDVMFKTQVLNVFINMEVILNFILFLSTFINMRLHNSLKTDPQTSPRSHNVYNQYSILLFVKLSLVMGFDWFLLFISNLFANKMCYAFALTVLECQGLFLFVILVCNKRVLSLLKDKWKGPQITNNQGVLITNNGSVETSV